MYILIIPQGTEKVDAVFRNLTALSGGEPCQQRLALGAGEDPGGIGPLRHQSPAPRLRHGLRCPGGGIGGEDGGTRAHLCRGQPLLPDETDQHLGGLLQGDGAGGTEGPAGHAVGYAGLVAPAHAGGIIGEGH